MPRDRWIFEGDAGMKTNVLVGVIVGLTELLLLWCMDVTGVLRSDLGARLLQFMLFVHALGLIVVMVRLRQSEHTAGFPKLLAAGLMVSFLAALTAGMGVLFFLEFVEPGYLSWVIEETRQDITDWPDDRRIEAEQQLAATTPMVYASRGAIGYLLRGLLLSLLLAAVLRLQILRSASDLDGQ
ncbi:MAG: DUF4199 family protein [Thermoanaerobaculia bacterium]|nr:DUF4199 family protein [Thermoanaerobaculia bacterium]